MKRHGRQHEGQCKVFVFGLPLFRNGSSLDACPSISNNLHYQVINMTLQRAKFKPRTCGNNCFGRRVMMSSTTHRSISHAGKMQNMSTAVSLRNSEAESCCCLTLCRAEPSSNMKIIHLASVCVKIPTCPAFLQLYSLGPV